MMRLAAMLFLMASPACAQDLAEASGGILRWLDKITGETADIELSNGEAAVSGQLTILMDECRYPVDNPVSNAFVHLTITDARVSSPVFAGWMIASSPALSALDHPRYDVWPLRCVVPAGALPPEPAPMPEAAPEEAATEPPVDPDAPVD
jgi:hypothetical protein